MNILDKAKEAAASAAEKTRELASSAAEAVEDAVEEAGVKVKNLASEAGDAAKEIGSAIANATFVDSAREMGVEEREQEAAKAKEIAASGEGRDGPAGDSGKG